MKKYSIRNFIPNLAHVPTPVEKSYNRKITNFTVISFKRLKPQIINPQSFILSHQTLTTFKNHI